MFKFESIHVILLLYLFNSVLLDCKPIINFILQGILMFIYIIGFYAYFYNSLELVLFLQIQCFVLVQNRKSPVFIATRTSKDAVPETWVHCVFMLGLWASGDASVHVILIRCALFLFMVLGNNFILLNYFKTNHDNKNYFFAFRNIFHN